MTTMSLEHYTLLDPAAADTKDIVAIKKISQQLGRASTRMPLVATPDEAQGLGDEIFFETTGQLEANLPPAVMPEMPADTYVKPDLATTVDRADQRATSDPRNRERPT